MRTKQRRIAVLGFRSVGKSSISSQFVNGEFFEAYLPTIQNTFNKNLNLRGQEYLVTLVDTAGQDEFSIFPTQYSMDIHGYVLVYSVTDPRSLQVVQIIHDKLLDMTGSVNVPIVLVGNKKDLQDEREITPEQGRKLANSWKAQFLEASSQNQESVTDIFNTILAHIEQVDMERCAVKWGSYCAIA
ncbi:GTP-binding protein Rheb-like [Folsomia candida]|uniref:GTP-binding protein Rheb-like n=1 Tax=Folsomia candida TaxID=158441 RepID=UPI000B907759|nr:GTP-binding protein Rheb-like [Folsomia candida]